ncbi:alpha/beta fold hydrolase [Pseudidiomarina sp. 1APR75-33.1]|uniref:alpha/beta fold hydrolase n=1 Tax=Pseudidiomarina terrestris TaxID=2820060 RepID=UPI0026524678|nr:alpha/beta fold hydrolase [Pseudidiomarina sp. 1APR75-33.1]MDN7125997.1 alpha/beta fold hydrolase [Pseudidiomarina sp. 1APR75-33.1]
MSYKQVDHLISTPQGQLAVRQQGTECAPNILVLGGISGGREVYTQSGEGWWQGLFRDTDLLGYNVWSLDYLGGMGASSCAVTPGSVELQAQAVEEALLQLGVKHLHALIGGSYGGCVGMALVAASKLSVARLAVLGAAHRATAQAVMLRSLQRDFIELAEQAGDAERGVVLARALAMVSYRGTTGLDARFSDAAGAIDFMHQRAQRLVQRDPWQARRLFTEFGPALDAFRVAPQRVQVPTFLLGFKDDLLVPPHVLNELQGLLPRCWAYDEVATAHGHDGFILNTAVFGPRLQEFLEDV